MRGLLYRIAAVCGAVGRYCAAARVAHPHDALVQKTVGLVLREAGRPDLALEAFRQAHVCDQQDAEVMYWLGRLDKSRGAGDTWFGIRGKRGR